jgi:hypothetical protein
MDNSSYPSTIAGRAAVLRGTARKSAMGYRVDGTRQPRCEGGGAAGWVVSVITDLMRFRGER